MLLRAGAGVVVKVVNVELALAVIVTIGGDAVTAVVTWVCTDVELVAESTDFVLETIVGVAEGDTTEYVVVLRLVCTKTAVVLLVGTGVVVVLDVAGAVVVNVVAGPVVEVVGMGVVVLLGVAGMVVVDVVAGPVVEVVGTGVVVLLVVAGAVVVDVVAGLEVEVVGHEPPSHRHCAEHPSPLTVLPSSHSSSPYPGFIRLSAAGHTGNTTDAPIYRVFWNSSPTECGTMMDGMVTSCPHVPGVI